MSGLYLVLHVLIVIFLPVLWGTAGIRAGRAAAKAGSKPQQTRRWVDGIVLLLGQLLVMTQIGLIGYLGSVSWLFVKDTMILYGLLVFLPAAVATVLRIRVLTRKQADFGRYGMVVQTVAIQATAVGSIIAASMTLFWPSFTRWGGEIVFAFVVFAGSVAILSFRRLGFPRTWLLSKVCFVIVFVGGSILPIGLSAQASVLSDRMNMMTGTTDDGGAGAGAVHQHGDPTGHGAGTVSVAVLTGPRAGAPDRRFALTAESETVRLASGASADIWSFNGELPGPELRVKQGELVEVELANKNIERGVTLHWHGVDVPNAEDGVAGVTQDAVMPGQSHTYRFVAEDAGTYWYHSHQTSSESVRKGLFGALIVEPSNPPQPDSEDWTVVAHTWETTNGSVLALGSSDQLERRTLRPGTPVRLRLINTENWPMTFTLGGTPFQVAAIDGTDLNEPTDLAENTQLQLAAGGRYDVTFTMPASTVRLFARVPEFNMEAAGLLIDAEGGTDEMPVSREGPAFDPSHYGKPKETPFGPGSAFDRSFTLIFDNKLGFFDGSFHLLWTINGNVIPNTPMLMVQEGDLVKTTFVNRSLLDHPMHLHGHHMLVLSRNGKSITGSPWWTDTLNVAPGEVYEVAFRADNPGLWMDHCHNLDHAKVGMVLHLAYEGITTPFETGSATLNMPE